MGERGDALLRMENPASALALGLRPVVAAGDFFVPLAFAVFPGNGAGLAGQVLFRRRALRREARRLMGGKRLRVCAVDLISPAAVVLDDAIDDLGHVTASLLSLSNGDNVAGGRKLW